MKVSIRERGYPRRSWEFNARTGDRKRAIQTALRWHFGPNAYFDVLSRREARRDEIMTGQIHEAAGEDILLYVNVTLPL